MKLIIKVLSLVISVLLVVFGVTIISGDEVLITDLIKTIKLFFTANFVPLITICAATLILIKEEKSSIIKIITIYMIMSLMISGLILFGNLNTMGTGISNNLIKIYGVIESLHNIMLVYILIKMVDVNNAVSNIFKHLSIVTVLVNVGSKLYLIFNNWFGIASHKVWDLIDYRELSNAGSDLMIKTSNYSIIILILLLVLLYLTDYAFTTEYLVNEDSMNIEDLKQKAHDRNIEKMNNIYKDKKEEIVYEKTETGTMNINNQLNYNSNVGQVNSQAKEINISNNSLESVFTNSGPVVNNNMDNNENKNDIV